MPSSINNFIKLVLVSTFIGFSTLASAEQVSQKIIQPEDILQQWQRAIEPFATTESRLAKDRNQPIVFKSSLSLAEKKQALIQLKSVAKIADQMRLDMWLNNTTIDPEMLDLGQQNTKMNSSNKKFSEAKLQIAEKLLAAESLTTTLLILARIQPPTENANSLDRHHETCTSASVNLANEDQVTNVELLKIISLLCN